MEFVEVGFLFRIVFGSDCVPNRSGSMRGLNDPMYRDLRLLRLSLL